MPDSKPTTEFFTDAEATSTSGYQQLPSMIESAPSLSRTAFGRHGLLFLLGPSAVRPYQCLPPGTHGMSRNDNWHADSRVALSSKEMLAD